jgi:coenzyme F420-dependent glucose-6-phosphate dehydrogenase
MLAYHCSHEQFSPSELLEYVQLAESAGFGAIHSSDHFHPWSNAQGHSGFTLSWLGAAMHACKLPFRFVCAPGQRLHPAILAQALATLDDMFPGRIAVELGSGEAMNEAITGEPWPDKEERNERLLESYIVIKRLLSGEEVNFNGKHITVKKARLFTLPLREIPLFAAALSSSTAEWAGTWADGLLTVADREVKWIEEKIRKFRKAGGGEKPVWVQFSFSFGNNYDEALQQAAHQWKAAMVPMDDLSSLTTPEEFEEKSAAISMDEVAEKIPIYTSIEKILADISVYRDLGVSGISLHNISKDHQSFFRAIPDGLEKLFS